MFAMRTVRAVERSRKKNTNIYQLRSLHRNTTRNRTTIYARIYVGSLGNGKNARGAHHRKQMVNNKKKKTDVAMFTGADEHDGPETAINASVCVCVCVCVVCVYVCKYGNDAMYTERVKNNNKKNPAKRNNLGGPK